MSLGLLIAWLLFGCGGDRDYPDNIILFIGDGMGVAHISAGKIAAGTLHLERFPVSGLVTTHSANRLVTESAAAATALATGKKPTTGPSLYYRTARLLKPFLNTPGT